MTFLIIKSQQNLYVFRGRIGEKRGNIFYTASLFQNSLNTFAGLSPPTWIKNSLKYPKRVHITV
jgi:hypothetical protein